MYSSLYTLYKHTASSNTSKLSYTLGFNLCVIIDDRIVNRWQKAWTRKISLNVLLLLSHDCPYYNRLPHKLFQVIWLAGTPKWLFALSNKCLKTDKKHRLLKCKALKVHSSIIQWQYINVHNIKYTIMPCTHTFA